MPYTLRDFILRCPRSSLSPREEEALRHEKGYPCESPDLPCAGMDCTDGEFLSLEVQERGDAQAQAATAPSEPLGPFPRKITYRELPDELVDVDDYLRDGQEVEC